jgi:hypothetical protein
VSHCVYDTSDATETIKGGDGTGDEMCLAFVRTYPPPDLQMALVMDDTLAKMAPMGVPADSVVCLAGMGELNGMSVGITANGRQAALATVKAGAVDKTEDFSDAPYREDRSDELEAEAMGYAEEQESGAHSLPLSVGPFALACLAAALFV